MKLMIMGYGRHGKDTVCEILRDEYGMTFESSSLAALRLAIYPVLKELIGYQTIEECYNDRYNHRALWHELIKAYNHNDKARLGRKVYHDCDVYCGIRAKEELEAIEQADLFDYAVWVDASERLPAETTDSCTVVVRDANYVLDNNGDLDRLRFNIKIMMSLLDRRMELGVTHV